MTIPQLISTSVDDCRISLEYVTDLEFLQQLHAECLRLAQPSRLRVVAARIRKVKMGKL